MLNRKTYRKYMRQKNLREAIKKQKQHAWINKKTERQIQYIVLMFFIGLLLTGFYGTSTLLTWNFIIRIYLSLAFIFSFIPLKILPLIYKIQPEIKLLLAVCGLAPFIIGISLTINYNFSSFNNTAIYKIEKFDVSYDEHIIQVQLENKQLKKHKELRKFSTDKFHFVPDSAAYLVYKGCLGIDVVKDSYLIKK